MPETSQKNVAENFKTPLKTIKKEGVKKKKKKNEQEQSKPIKQIPIMAGLSLTGFILSLVILFKFDVIEIFYLVQVVVILPFVGIALYLVDKFPNRFKP